MSGDVVHHVHIPTEMFMFRGIILRGEPRCPEGTAETDVKKWLYLLESIFGSTGLTDDRARILQLCLYAHKRYGDARFAMFRYLSEDYKNNSYSQVKEELLAVYGAFAPSTYVLAARELVAVVEKIHRVLVKALGNILKLRDVVLKVVHAFLDRPCYNGENEIRSHREVATQVVFDLAAA
jgi:hypothetical protein